MLDARGIMKARYEQYFGYNNNKENHPKTWLQSLLLLYI